MSPSGLHLRNRPREPLLPSRSSRIFRILRAFAFSLPLILALAALAFAQPPRESPGDPPAIPGGTDEGWQVLSIPNLPLGAILGDVWASPGGKLYVWTKYPSAAAVYGDDGGEGERLPNPPGGPKPMTSTLYSYDGMLWTTVLRTPGEIGDALYGSGDQVYASTRGPSNEVHVYSFHGTTWSHEYIAGYHVGQQLHTFAGVPGDLYLKLDNDVMHNTGAGFDLVYEMPGYEGAVRGMVYTDAQHLFVLCPSGHYVLDGGAWTPFDEAYSFSDVQDAWGMRDASGVLQLFAVGSNNRDNGIYIWRYTETDPVTHKGTWATVASDPPGTGVPGVGCGQHIWGSAGNDVYATGVVAGKGEMMRFDGFTWKQLYPPAEFGAIHGVSGNGDGVVWFSTENGQIIRYRHPAPPTAASIVGTDTRTSLRAEVHRDALTVRYDLPATTPVELGLYDVMGRQLGTIEEGVRAPGTHEASWNLGSLDSGIYFVKLRTMGAAFTRRVVVIR